jgi:DNA-binding LacI/PurR family transcriptional regulator
MTTGSPARVTSADVARAAGVSRATVSYVLNDSPHQSISAATRDRVLDAATRLGYAPSAAARLLRTGKSDVVLCLVPDWPIGHEVGALLADLSAELGRAGLTFVAHPRSRADRPIGELWKAITPAAVLAFIEVTHDEIAAMRAAGVALVLVLTGDTRVPQRRVGHLQAEFLATAGHTRLGYADSDDPRVRIFAEPRLDGVRDGCTALGLDAPLVRTVALEPAVTAVRQWRAAGVTGICAYNDEVALAVLAGARRAGVAVPGGLAVIGVDDIPAARLAEPPLTTVATDQRVVAAHLAQALLAAIRGGHDPVPDLGGTVRVVARGSA